MYCLASEHGGAPVENPRQKSSWQYSARYGPVPPCFSRATVATIGRDSWLLIGGTASIVGEDSRHVTNPSAQLTETLRNLAALVNTARRRHDAEAVALTRLVDLRAYVANPDHACTIRSLLTTACGAARRVDLVHARICRPELLVEVEAVAEL